MEGVLSTKHLKVDLVHLLLFEKKMTKFIKSVSLIQILAFAVLPVAASAAVTPVPEIAVSINVVQTLIVKLGTWLFTVILALAAVVLLVGAFNILTAGGDAAKVTTGKNWIIWGVVGVMVAVLAKGILTLACDFISQGQFVC